MPVESPPKPLDIRLVFGTAFLMMGGALLAIGVFHLFQNGTCSTNGYAHFGGINNASGRYYPVPYCAAGIGWWVLVGGGGVVAMGVAAILSTADAKLALAVLFAALCAGCILLGLHVSKPHPMAGFSVTGARVFCISGAVFWALFTVGFGWGGSSGFPAFAGVSGMLAALASVLGIAAAVVIGQAVNTANAPAKPKPAAAPAQSSVVAGDSAASLLKSANLAPVLAAASKKVGSDAFVEALALTPSEFDITVENTGSGTATTYRIGRGGAITASTPFAFSQGNDPSIFLSSIKPSLGGVAAQAAGVPISRVSKISLVRAADVTQAYFSVATTTASGAVGPTGKLGFIAMTQGQLNLPVAPKLPTGSYAACTVAAGTDAAKQAKCEKLLTGKSASSEAQKALAYSQCVMADPTGATTKCASLLP